MNQKPETPASVTAAASSLQRWIVPLLGFAALALASLAYSYDRPLYIRLLTSFMLTPQTTPFIDAQAVPAMITCLRQGVDVFIAVPCDPLQRVWDYSPLWLWATCLPPWANWMGICLDCTFFLALTLLPQPRQSGGLILNIVAIFSSASVFLLERANVDLLLFVLIVIGARFWTRRPALRLIGYLLFAIAGFLKFYPMVLLLLFIRERFTIFIALSAAAAATLAAFILHYRIQLREIAYNLPIFSYFTDAFGAKQLPDGLATALPYLLRRGGIHDPFILALPAQSSFSLSVWAILLAASLAITIRLALRAPVRTMLATLPADEIGFLLVSATMMCGCFFAGTSECYRSVFLLLALPGLLTLASVPALSRVFGFTITTIVFVMWGLTIQFFVGILSGGQAFPMSNSVAIYLYWIIHELAWWWIISVLLAILFCFIGQSPVWRLLTGRERPA